MKHSRLPVIAALAAVTLAFFTWLTTARPLAQRTSGGLTIDQLIDIRHPSNPMWSADGRHVVFVWDRAGVSKVYVADVPTAWASAAAPRELPAAGSQLTGVFWGSDGALMVPGNGDLWRVPLDGGGASAVW